MRIGIALPPADELRWAQRADELGLAAVLVRRDEPGAAASAAGAVAASTRDVRIAVETVIGEVHPVASAETLAVLDHLSGGRIIGAVRPAPGLSGHDVAEDVELLRRALRPGPVRHRGTRWRVPAGISEHQAPDAVEVTPKPVQPVLPLWWDGPGDGASVHGLPRVVTDPEDVDASAWVAPAKARQTGDLDDDRGVVQAWAAVGATDLYLVPADAQRLELLDDVVRYLSPEAAMPQFPRIIAESALPAAWPGG
jgi:alkanesulfonate monooxygenase SsuD/methylene tetrahydromethanopterin reductase-like flavin-dependent oxidoreductase (luciferase family)